MCGCERLPLQPLARGCWRAHGRARVEDNGQHDPVDKGVGNEGTDDGDGWVNGGIREASLMEAAQE